MVWRASLLPNRPWPAIAPPLPVREFADWADPEYVDRVQVDMTTPSGIALRGFTPGGQELRVRVEAVSAGVVRVQFRRPDADLSKRTRLARDSGLPPRATVREQDDHILLEADEIVTRVTRQPFGIVFSTPGGRRLLAHSGAERDVGEYLTTLPCGFTERDSQVFLHDSFLCEPDEHFYGFGEKFTDFDKRGQIVQMWNYDAHGVHHEQAYKNVPFVVSTRGYGVFVDSHRHVQFDMAASNHSAWSIVCPGEVLDYYVIAGPGLARVIELYTDLVGGPARPPKWAYGLWVSSGFTDDSAAETLRRAKELRQRAIPSDVLHLDCYWQEHGTWSNMEWNGKLFPEPERLVTELRRLGFRVCLWINPYLSPGTERYREADENGFFLKRPDGTTYVLPLWGTFHPPVAIVDVTNPRAAAWYQELLRPHLRMGVDVFKTDFGEGVPRDAVAHNGMSGEELHNLYPLLYNDLVATVTTAETGGSGLVWGRSTYAGGQRHAAQWGGDPNCSYPAMASTLRGGLSLAMCGHAFWSHDIGGFHRTPAPDLYVRWAQFGLLSPLSRAHGMTSRLPWDFGEEALEIFRTYVRLRYHLLPYLYTYGVISAESGLPIMRPLVLEFPDDPATHAIDLQYLLGRELMVAPVFNPEGVRDVYFPAGGWVDYWTREVLEGPGYRTVEAPLERLPLYVRLDSLLPTIEPAAHISEEPFRELTFRAFLRERAGFRLRDVDGDTMVDARLDGSALQIEASGARTAIDLVVELASERREVTRVLVNGRPLGAEDRAWRHLKDGRVHVPVTLP
ncbi:alpha-xylosidase [Jiangella aurantiaca]|uniref:Alpha-xylosidase n=1 Tax=Jiangella aurantiaca TaxID=2530373 RepID=A0A4R5A3V6_9ACTN|nr:alpha-xylosidase [Jiangella aurantiaca]TDD65556.1 alpha-xylosidase [Jiangella aurantiaca]